MISSFCDHTLLITTFNRSRFLLRLLTHISHDLPVGRILIVDGSLEPSRARNRDIVAEFSNQMPVELHQLQPDIASQEQFDQALDLVETTYVTYCQDDNFCVAATIRECVQFLRDRSDYVACSGHVISLDCNASDVRASLVNAMSLEQENPFERFENYLACRWPAEFGVWRSKALNRGKVALDLMTRDQTMAEPLHPALGLIEGKLKVLPLLGAVFCWHNHNLSGRAGRRYGTIIDGFGENISRATQMIVSTCEMCGIDPPVDVRRFYVSAYMRSMLKWFDDTRTSVPILQNQESEGISSARWQEMVEYAESAILKDLLDLSSDDHLAIYGLMRNANAIRYPMPHEIFRVVGQDIILSEVNPRSHMQDNQSAENIANPIPTALSPLVEKLSDCDWSSIYDDFVELVGMQVLGVSTSEDFSRHLFDAVFQQALTNVSRPLVSIDQDQTRLLSESMSLPANNSLMLKQLQLVLGFIRKYPDPCQDGDTVEYPLDGIVPESRYRIVPANPPAEAESQPIMISSEEILQNGAITFLPVGSNSETSPLHAPGKLVWLRVRLGKLAGRLQFGLYGHGQIDKLTTKIGTGGETEVIFFIDDTALEFLVLRDLRFNGVPANCEIAGIEWVVLDENSNNTRSPNIS